MTLVCAQADWKEIVKSMRETAITAQLFIDPSVIPDMDRCISEAEKALSTSIYHMRVVFNFTDLALQNFQRGEKTIEG